MVVELANDANRSQGNSRGAACVPKRNDAQARKQPVDIFHQRTMLTGQKFSFGPRIVTQTLIRSYYGLTN